MDAEAAHRLVQAQSRLGTLRREDALVDAVVVEAVRPIDAQRANWRGVRWAFGLHAAVFVARDVIATLGNFGLVTLPPGMATRTNVLRVVSALAFVIGTTTSWWINEGETTRRRSIARTRYDVVLMDVQMPATDGLDASREINRCRPRDRPHIVAMTADAMQGDRETCLAAGMDGYATRPIRVDVLVAATERIAIPVEQGSS